MSFSRGPHTLAVSVKLHQLNRSRLIERLRKNPALKADANDVVLLEGAKSTFRHCSDHEPYFRQESYFHWAFGVREPDFYGAIELKTGKATLFAPKLPDTYAIWYGPLKTREQIRDTYGVDDVQWVDDIKSTLKKVNAGHLLTLYGLNSDSGNYSTPAKFEGIEEFSVNPNVLHHDISDLRAIKTDLEIEVLRYAAKVSSEAHKEVMRRIRPGMLEYQLDSIFKHYCSYHGGSEFMAYACICATGENGAVLHYGHAGDQSRVVKDGDICLFDMGCEYFCYCSDITCSFPANGKFTSKQKIIYNAVLDANHAVTKSVRPGVSWVDMHVLAQRRVLEGLTKAGLLKGCVDEMLKNGLGYIFFPHGLGHFLGVDTHDVGGYLKGYPERSSEMHLKCLRTSRVLEKNMCITIEPGCYFSDTLLDRAYADPKLNQFLVKEVLEEYRGFGGVRIEDDVIITENGCEVLNNVPRTVEEIEAFMADNQKQQ